MKYPRLPKPHSALLLFIALLVICSPDVVLASSGSWVRAESISEQTERAHQTRRFSAYLALNDQTGVGASVPDGSQSPSPWGIAQGYTRLFADHRIYLPRGWRGTALLGVLLHDGNIRRHRHAAAGSQLGLAATRDVDAWRFGGRVSLVKYQPLLDDSRDGDRWTLVGDAIRRLGAGRYEVGGVLQVEHYLPPNAGQQPATLTLLGISFEVVHRHWTVGATVQTAVDRSGSDNLDAMSEQHAILRLGYAF